MNKSIWTRVLAALGGVALWVMGLCALAETFFHVPVTAKVGQLLGAGTPMAVLATLLFAIALCAFGVGCLMALSPKRAAKRTGFVMQKGENGAIGVSVKSIEGLVQTCIKQHEVVASAEIAVVERKDGIVILLDIREAAGVNIPLAVGALQKQIKQYVTDCTGVDVREVRVLVDNTDEEAPQSPYAVKGPAMLAASRAAEAVVAPVETVAFEPVEDIPEEQPVVEESYMDEVAEEMPVVQMPPIPPMPEIHEIMEEEDDRPLHQRLFGTEEQPVFVPAPPEMVIETSTAEAAEEPIGEIVEESAGAEAAEEVVLAEETDPNAVLEVVEAISYEEEILPEVAEEAPAEESADEAEIETVKED